MSFLGPAQLEWRDCKKDPPNMRDDLYGIILVQYEKYNMFDGDVEYGITQARWNGLEWRTEDFGSLQSNLFDQPFINPIRWSIIKYPYV